MLLKPFELQQEPAEYLIRKKKRPLIPGSTKVGTYFHVIFIATIFLLNDLYVKFSSDKHIHHVCVDTVLYDRSADIT